MGKADRFAPFIVLLIAFVVLQAILLAADSRQTPAKAAKSFIEAYYYLDPEMQDWLCTDQNNAGMVDRYLHAKAREAAQQGYELSYFRHMFTKMHVTTISAADDAASVHITGTTRVAINPVFMVVGKLFGLGKDYPVDITLELVKEGKRWRVCDIRA